MHLTKRQKEIFDFVRGFISRNGYAPSLEEIGVEFGLSSVATVHKHVSNLVEKGVLRKAWNRSRSIEVVEDANSRASVVVPLLGRVAAGIPIEAVPDPETISVPASMVGDKEVFALSVQGDSMIEDRIADGDLVLLESRRNPRPGETVVALIRREECTLKRFYPNGATVRLVPANRSLTPMEFPSEEVEIQGVVVGLLRRY